MNSRSTQRFVGLVVAAVVSVLLLIALPAKERERAPREQELAASEPELSVFELQDGWWVLPRHGVRMRLPPGWEPRENQSRPYAYRDLSAALAGNLNVLSLPNFFNLDLEGIAEENRKSLEAAAVLELISLADHRLGGDHPALRIDYGGSPRGEELHFAAIVFLHGPDQVVITAAATAEQWPVIEEDVRASLESIELLAPPQAAPGE
jgi:hypothetical protein